MPAIGKAKQTGELEVKFCSTVRAAELVNAGPVCIACGGTGVNSKGGRCAACERREMMEWLKRPIKIGIPDMFED